MSTNIKPTFWHFYNILTSSPDKKLTLKQSSHKGVVWNPNFTIPLELLNQFSFVFYCFSSSSVSNVYIHFQAVISIWSLSAIWSSMGRKKWSLTLSNKAIVWPNRLRSSFFTVDISYCIVLLYYIFQHIILIYLLIV